MSALLVVSHSAGNGGAETALQRLLMFLRALGHTPVVLLPSREGGLVDWCKRNRFEGLVLDMQHALPDATTAFLQVSMQGIEGITEQLRPRGFAAVITNTTAVFQGSRMAELLGVPHISWIHELIDDGSEVRCTGIPPAEYLRVVGAGADHLLCCSQAVQQQLRDCGVETPSSVLYPQVDEDVAPAAAGRHGRIELLAIGVQSVRKNPAFALTVLQALRLRGRDAVLHLVGANQTQSPRVKAAIERRGLAAAVHRHGEVGDPYALADGCVINLVGATHEPFGLTITEALARGVPVVASRSGGPQELLADADLFDVGDVDACVRRIEAVADDYAAARGRALQRYAEIRPSFAAELQQRIVAEALESAQARHRTAPRQPVAYMGPRVQAAIGLAALPHQLLLDNIAQESGLTRADIEQRVQQEKAETGRAVLEDCRRYDVVPFSPSPQMDRLYREGVGFAIELAASYGDDGRMLMAGFIISRMLYEAKTRPLRVLALGDGIGIDSLRLASMGFDVDYIDFDGSLTSRIARRNFQSFAAAAPAGAGRVSVIGDASTQPPYDVVVCLEVIEHVSDPHGFMAMLSDRLAPGGLLFISECFDGVRNHWPTHLQSNEDYAALLPMMAADAGLVLDDYMNLPFGKPYVLRKAAPGEPPRLAQRLRDEKELLRNTFGAQWRIGA